MLRISEAAALTWNDMETQPDGSGRLLIRRSKTDPDGEDSVAFLSSQIMAALKPIDNAATDSDSMFVLNPSQISRRIKRAAHTAGLRDGFSGHAPRVGMTRCPEERMRFRSRWIFPARVPPQTAQGALLQLVASSPDRVHVHRSTTRNVEVRGRVRPCRVCGSEHPAVEPGP